MLAPAPLTTQVAPRYTSYPTSPQFSKSIGAADAAAWLRSLATDAAISLYIHVPYCAKLCHYCGCHTKIVRREEPVDAYAHRLADEVRTVGNLVGDRKVVHIHWGGGTPTILGTERLRGLFTALADSFDLDPALQHAIELDPRRLDAPLVATLREIGVNRASLGVQEFSPRVQEAIGRIQPFEVVADSVALLRHAGIDRISFDLMYGLPQQLVADVRRTAELAVSLKPSRIALFGYAHVPWFKANQRLIDERLLPDATIRLEQSEAAREALVGFGYEPIGMDHFALPDDDLAVAARRGRLHRNFQGYTSDRSDAIVGLGASAISSLPQGFTQNAVDIHGYSKTVAAGCLATVRGHALSPDDRLRGRIIERLMCYFQVDLDTIAADTIAAGMSKSLDFEIEMSSLLPFANNGMLQIEGRRITVTDAGRPFVRVIASVFDAYLSANNARYSRAV
jgi:oxygen-independent coproporphyrinogen-3 oxidase